MAKNKTEAAVIIPITDEKPVKLNPQLLEVTQKSGLDLTKAERYAAGYAPMMGEIIEQAAIIKVLDKTKPEDAAKAKRASLDLGKICSRLDSKKKEDKATLLIETRLIDGLYNVAESTGRLTQKEADEIVNYLAEIEKERLNKIADTRRAELESFEAVTTYLPLAEMTDEQYSRCLDDAKITFNARKEAAEKAEALRIETERLAEEAKIEAIRKDAEARAAQQAENERLRKENEEKEKQLAAERAAAQVEQKRLSDLAEAARKKQQAENERLAAEAKKAQDELKAKQAAIDLAEQKERERIEAEAAERAAREKAALLAPDKEKVNALYLAIKAIEIPEFKTPEAISLGKLIKNEIAELLIKVKNNAKLLK